MGLNHALVKKVFGDASAYTFEGAPIEEHPNVKMEVRDLHISYGHRLTERARGLFGKRNPNSHKGHERKGRTMAVKNVSLPIYENEVLALIGASGCGKSTLLRALNRMNDSIDGCLTSGHLLLDGEDIYARDLEPELLRRRVSMVFQKPNPLAKSIYENVAYGPRLHGLVSKKGHMDDHVEEHLSKAGLFDEVKDRLKDEGHLLSGGQQQRLCIARATSIEPEVILMDEPCASLDPISTAHIEELIREIRKDHTVALITHNLAQAARISQRVAHFHMGEMLSYGKTKEIFKDEGEEPTHETTRNYVMGTFG